MTRFRIRLPAVIIGLFAIAAVAADEFLRPDEITWLPASLKDELKSEGCRIQFAAWGQVDLAVLCVSGRRSYIAIAWGGDKSCSSRLESYGESLSVVDEYFISEHYKAYGGNEPPWIEHEAINDEILEKASVVRYCHKGDWIELTGAD